MIGLKIIKNNKVVYSGNVLKISVNAENLGTIEFQQGCSNSIYKIHGDIKYTTEQSKEENINIPNGVVSVSAETIEVVE